MKITIPRQACYNVIGFILLLSYIKPAFSSISFFPEDYVIYPDYIADTQRATSGIQYLRFSDSDIADASKDRLALRLGGSFLLASWDRDNETQPRFQFVLDGGFYGQFDNNYNQDNVGWNGIYGLRVLYRPNNNIAWSAGTKHLSGHLGDEYQERTGRTRIKYTREEFIAGLIWSFHENNDIYLELGRAYNTSDKPLQERDRMQTGIQYQKANSLFDNQYGWYVALDVTAYEENDWHRNVTLQGGIYTGRHADTWRFEIEFYDGRSLLGEFFSNQERYTSIGFTYDF